MNKLGPELMVTVTSSDNAHKRFSELIKDPFIVPLFKILSEPICLSIQAEDSFSFTIKTISGENFTATAMHFDIHNHWCHYVVLGGDMETTKEISPIVFKALRMFAKNANFSDACNIGYDSLEGIATCESNGHTERVGVLGLKNFSRLCGCINSILSGEMAEKLKNKCCEEDVLS